MKKYEDKEAEWRKEFFIRKFIPDCESILDLGCGPGEYGPALRKKCRRLSGLDQNPDLLKISSSMGYDSLYRAEISRSLDFKSMEFDCVWCSEVLEHFPDLDIVGEIERITSGRIIFTLPNPMSPHFSEDETHILKYDVNSLISFFGRRKHWKYKVRGMGFNEVPLPAAMKKLTTFVLFYLPWLSPTIAVIGTRTGRQDVAPVP